MEKSSNVRSVFAVVDGSAEDRKPRYFFVDRDVAEKSLRALLCLGELYEDPVVEEFPLHAEAVPMPAEYVATGYVTRDGKMVRTPTACARRPDDLELTGRPLHRPRVAVGDDTRLAFAVRVSADDPESVVEDLVGEELRAVRAETAEAVRRLEVVLEPRYVVCERGGCGVELVRLTGNREWEGDRLRVLEALVDDFVAGVGGRLGKVVLPMLGRAATRDELERVLDVCLRYLDEHKGSPGGFFDYGPADRFKSDRDLKPYLCNYLRRRGVI